MASKTGKPAGKTKKSVVRKVAKKVSDKRKSVSKRAVSGSAMDRLMANQADQIRAFKRGQEISGVVTFLGRTLMLVDIGAKTEGMVMDRELKDARDLLEDVKVGDKIKAYIKDRKSVV